MGIVRGRDYCDGVMGFEIELDRRVTNADGGMFDGDELLAGFKEGRFRLLTDARDADEVKDSGESIDYSNVEFVTDPFDQLAPGDPVGPLLAGLRGVADVLYSPKGRTSLVKLLSLQKLGFWVTRTNGAGAFVESDLRIAGPKKKVYMVSDKGVENLFVHYTVGVPIGKLDEALRWIGQKARAVGKRPFAKISCVRAAHAGTAAEIMFTQWAGRRQIAVTEEERTTLRGFVALVYTQVAAIIDHSYVEGAGQIKNKAVALSRVPLREVAKTLPEQVQWFLKEQAFATLLADTDDAELKDLNAFVAVQVASAQRHREQRYADAEADLATILADIAAAEAKNSDDPEDAWNLSELRASARDITLNRDYVDQALNEWQNLAGFLPSYKKVYQEQQDPKFGFPWSILDDALVPALEGRAISAAPTGRESPGDLFEAGAPEGSENGPDGGPIRDLETLTTCNPEEDEDTAISEVNRLTVGAFLNSALLLPGVPTVSVERVFGGMKEIHEPDHYLAGGVSYRLVPLELRAHGDEEVNWKQLEVDIREIIGFSHTLFPAPPPVHAPVHAPVHPPAQPPGQAGAGKRQATDPPAGATPPPTKIIRINQDTPMVTENDHPQ
ncbi:hypothetical protein AB0F88_39505 [Streptosporangium sp. NPDC023963]|uniref:hypothetical protein n=1 Tax=Streptosporangium sp. NPDC023963 TaxID=3155608 RepID=UPI00341A5123